MNMNAKILAASIALAIGGCGGSGGAGGGGSATVNGIALSDQSVAGDGGFTAAQLTESADLTVTNVTMDEAMQSSSGITSIPFTVELANLGSGYDVSQLSLALEYSRSGDFNSTYRTALFDLRPDTLAGDSQTVQISARTIAAELPAGTYQARIVVNPNWQYYFSNIEPDSNHSQAFRYMTESDYSNNSSTPFQIQVNSDVVCAEDNLEDNNNFNSAVTLQAGVVINAALCEDDVDLFAIELSAGESANIDFSYISDSNTGTDFNRAGTRYLVIGPSFKRHDADVIKRPSSSIQIRAEQSGRYAIALYGARASYRITRVEGAAQETDWFFANDALTGPVSPVYGQINHSTLQFTKAGLQKKTVNCSRFVLEYDNAAPAGYSTPAHFTGVHEFHFIDEISYLLDGDLFFNWEVISGDIFNEHWYRNSHTGVAENIGDGGWRYWDELGESYVECRVR